MSEGNGSGIVQGRRVVPAWAVLTLVCLGQFMVVLDISVVNVALPSIQRDLGFSQSGLQWVVNAYTLAFAGFLLLGGRAGDLFGRRRMFIVGLGVFAGASLVGGLAQNSTMLVAARAIQGLGGAILAPATLTILTISFTEKKERARALGVWSAMAAAGGASGAILGGFLTDALSWRWILYINVPIGVGAVIAARAVLGESKAEPRERRGLDVAGALTVTAGLVSLVYGIVGTEQHGWTSWNTLVPVALAAVLLATFVLIEARLAPSPLMPLGLFRSRSVSGANLVILLTGGAFFAMWYFLSLYMQNVLGWSPLKAGFAFVPMTAAIVVGAQLAARLVPVVGPRPLLVIGGVAAAAGLAWMSGIAPHGSYVGDLLGPGLLVTLGLGLAFTPVAFAATAGVPPRDAGLASGVLNTTRQIGGSVGLAVLATLSTDRALAIQGVSPSHELFLRAQTAGYSRAFAVGAVIAGAGALAALVVPSIRPGRARVAEPTTVEAGVPEPIVDA